MRGVKPLICKKCGNESDGSEPVCSACGNSLTESNFDILRSVLRLLRILVLSFIFLYSGTMALKMAASEFATEQRDSIYATLYYWGALGYALLVIVEVVFAVLRDSGYNRRLHSSLANLGAELIPATVVAMILSCVHFIAGTRYHFPGSDHSFRISLAISSALFGCLMLILHLVRRRK